MQVVSFRSESVKRAIMFVVARRQRAINNFRADAAIIVVLRAPLMPNVRSTYHQASALFLEEKTPPRQLDQPAPHSQRQPGIRRVENAPENLASGRHRNPHSVRSGI